MSEMVTLNLDDMDAGRVIDALKNRVKVYRATERYHNGETVDVMIEEVTDADEARSIAKGYEGVIVVIQEQVMKQTIEGIKGHDEFVDELWKISGISRVYASAAFFTLEGWRRDDPKTAAQYYKDTKILG